MNIKFTNEITNDLKIFAGLAEEVFIGVGGGLVEGCILGREEGAWSGLIGGTVGSLLVEELTRLISGGKGVKVPEVKGNITKESFDEIRKRVLKNIDKGWSKVELNTEESIKNIINGRGYSVDEFAQLLHPDRVLTDLEKN